jgi:hypothetical protein
MQKFVTTSITEATGVSASDCATGMLYGMQFLESSNLKVKKLIHLFMDTRGAFNLLFVGVRVETQDILVHGWQLKE